MSEPTAAPSAAARGPLRATLLRAAAQYSIGLFLGLVASVARVGITARVLSPEQNGIWLGLQLVVGYAGNVHLGSLYGLFRSVPMLRARGDDQGAEAEKRTGFGFLLIMSALGAVAVTVVAPRVVPGAERLHVTLTVVLLLANLLRMYTVTLFRAESRFGELSAASALGALVSLATLPLVMRFALVGLLTGMIAQASVEATYVLVRSRLPRPRVEWSVLRQQLRVGLMTLVITVGVMALTNADRTMMLRVFGPNATGLYYLGANIVILLPALSTAPAAVLTPRFFERVGRGEDLMPLVEGPLRAMAYVQAWLCVAAAVALPAVVHRLWPVHVPGIPAAMAALFATYPLVLAGLVTNAYYALDRQGIHAWILGASAVLACVLAWVGARLAGTITGAAAGSAVAVYAYYAATSVAALRLLRTHGRTGGEARLAFRSLLPVAWAALLLAGVDRLLGPTWREGSIGAGLLAEAIVALGFAPFAPRVLAIVRGRRAAAAASVD